MLCRDDIFRSVAIVESKDDSRSASRTSISRTRFTGEVYAETRLQETTAQSAPADPVSSPVRAENHSSAFSIFHPRVGVQNVGIVHRTTS